MDILPQIIDSYNHSYHRSIKNIPANVNDTNETSVWATQYKQLKKPIKDPKFNVGDAVRIPKHKSVFTKGYIEKWTDEEFTITDINSKYVPHLYTLSDSNNQVIKGSFYEQELQLVDNPQNLYRIEKVLKTRTINGKKEALVKWRGYTEPTWIDNKNLISITNI